jgi:uncharacterized protein (TIGR01244 family)
LLLASGALAIVAGCAGDPLRPPPRPAAYVDVAAVVERLGLEYVSLPVPSPSAVTFENAEKLDRLLAGIDGPVLVHCASGNRVGALLALRESLNGADAEQAMAYDRQAGVTRLESVVRQRLLEDGKTRGPVP